MTALPKLPRPEPVLFDPKTGRPRNVEADWYDPALPRILRPRRAAPVQTLVLLCLILLAGTLTGIATAFLMIERERPFLAVNIGPWSAHPKAGTAEADPYSVAIYTRGARVPLASGEGLALTARSDSTGARLDPRCSYRISGQTPAARLWTLTSSDGYGRLSPTLAARESIDSRQVLRHADGSFDITASIRPRSGNWLPLPAAPTENAGLMFTLRIYDAPITTGAALDGVTMPDIVRLSCP
ncbi:DUF1214 domain-containing protein [Roseibium litorale]|uniref:DUF1214 domain-containing protein n=1 Tax=Roseibium litorale TaxID=2803841 RepID=A0ABR9CRL5_9HYPH|nr:DUF1214 domain-containing protein [Roseibium litorale]MBD8893520.1 DUF1214 domain-containing protein [Roseibium litorale]